MKLLLDTHVVLWWVSEHEKLSPEARAALLDEENELFVSMASAWEIAIKTSLGKLTDFDGGVKNFFKLIEALPIQLFSLNPFNLAIVETLPFIHRDPFDRMLVATAQAANMTILTADENIHKYDVLTKW